MRFATLAPVVAFLALAQAQDTNLTVVRATFEKYKIPQNLGITFKPTALLNVIFPQNDVTRPIVVTAGDELRVNVTLGPPRYALSLEPVTTPVDPKGRYVVIAVDPDAPTPESPSMAQVRHFLGGGFVRVNVPSPSPQVTIPLLANATAAITEWVHPTPPVSTTALPHRYIFLVYRESAAFATQKIVTPETPLSKFDVAKFAKATELGDPIAGTFFLARSGIVIQE